jgi:hypothetical protein
MLQPATCQGKENYFDPRVGTNVTLSMSVLVFTSNCSPSPKSPFFPPPAATFCHSIQMRYRFRKQLYKRRETRVESFRICLNGKIESASLAPPQTSSQTYDPCPAPPLQSPTPTLSLLLSTQTRAAQLPYRSQPAEATFLGPHHPPTREQVVKCGVRLTHCFHFKVVYIRKNR